MYAENDAMGFALRPVIKVTQMPSQDASRGFITVVQLKLPLLSTPGTVSPRGDCRAAELPSNRRIFIRPCSRAINSVAGLNKGVHHSPSVNHELR